MNPFLVDSSKNMRKIPVFSEAKTFDISAQSIDLPMTITSNIKSVPKVKSAHQIVLFESSFTRENLILKYEEIADRILLHPQGEYMRKLLEFEKSFIEQARKYYKKIDVSWEYLERIKNIYDSIIEEFIRVCLPNFATDSLQRIVSNTSTTISALSLGLEQCFCNKSVLYQFDCSYHFSPALLDFWKKTFPDIEQIRAVPMDAYAMMTSPWASSIDYEEFVSETFNLLRELISGDQEVGFLLTLLALFSPVNVHLCKEEMFCMKQFQSKITTMIYNHFLSQESFDNVRALGRVTQLVKIIEKIHKCGEILQEGIIYHDAEDNIEDIETIEIVELSKYM